MRLFVLTRHAESTYNVECRINGDPSVRVPLTAHGREEARQLGTQLSELPIELCIHTRFPRTRETAEEVLRGRDASFFEEPLLAASDVGVLEGQTAAAGRVWKHEHRRSDPFPGGESLDDAARRYALALEGLLARPERTIFVVCHEIAIRYALNAAAGSDGLDQPAHAIPNATPYLFDSESLASAAKRVVNLANASDERHQVDGG